MDEFLQWIGLVTLITLTCFLIVVIYGALRELIDILKRKHQYKHRFDKPTTAECYCIDCKYHNNETTICYRFGETTGKYRCTADNWFCWEATPREKE